MEINKRGKQKMNIIYLLLKKMNWIIGETEDGHMPLVRKPQHVIDEDRGDEIRQLRKEQAQREMYDDPVMNWSGLR